MKTSLSQIYLPYSDKTICPGQNKVLCPLELTTHRTSLGQFACDSHGHPVVERGVRVFVRNHINGKILGISTNDKVRLPGGAVDVEDDSDWEAAIRILREDTGLDLLFPTPLFTAWDTSVHGAPKVITTFTGNFQGSTDASWYWPSEMVQEHGYEYNNKLFGHIAVM